MIKKSKKALVMFFWLMLVTGLLFMSSSEPAWASESSSVHADQSTFEKNTCLSVDQKEYTITECEKVVSEILTPEMSDLEKYYTLAIWARKRVVYDWDFWYNTYNFDYYSHQWDAYGAMKEDETSVCVGISVFYADLCHAADLPCWIVRTEPDVLEHTINYIPDINGNAYYVDITENDYLMSDAGFDYAEHVDKTFSHITKDCTDTTFEYRSSADDYDFEPSNIKECYDKPYSDWFNEYALHQNPDKYFDTDYVERGSGKRSGEQGYRHASYQNYRSNFVEKGDVWFLDDFYNDPAAIKSKILNKEFDEQLLDISGLEKNYFCDTIEELKTAVEENISVKYFPTSEGGKIVAKSAALIKGADYKVTYTGHDDQAKDEVFSIEAIEEGSGAYKGEYRIHVKMNSAEVVREPSCKKGLVYNENPQELVKPGEAEGGEMQYAIGTETDVPEDFSAAIPTAVNAGKYYVWYRVAGDENHVDTQPQRLEKAASIDPKPLKIILEDVTIKVGETGVLTPELDVEVPVRFTFESWDKNVATVTEDGVVEGLKAGSVPIEVNAILKDSNSNYAVSNSIISIVKVVPADVEPDTAEPDTVDIGQTIVSLSESSFTYNGKVQKPSIETINGMKLTAGTDYTVKWSDASSKNVGTYTVTVTGMGKYTGISEAAYEIVKAENPLRVKGRTKAIKVRYSKLRKKSKTFKTARLMTFADKGQGTKKYTLLRVSRSKYKRYFKVNSKTGKLTVKKGLRKGTYVVKVKVMAAGNSNYNASAKTVKYTIRVK